MADEIPDEIIEDEIESDIPPKLEDPAKLEEELVVEEIVEEEVAPFKTFASEAEYQTWREQELGNIRSEQIEKVIPTPKEAEPFKIYDGHIDEKTGEWVGEKPKDMNEFAERLLTHPQALEKLKEQLVPETQKAIAELSQKEVKELDEINKGFDNEYDELAKSGKIPARNTDDGKKINEQITQIGADYGQSSLTKAYELWSRIPISEGGGLDYTVTSKMGRQKQQAGMVKGSKGGAGAGKKELNYNDIHNKSLDEIMSDEYGD